MSQEAYLGDGLYASFDGYQIVLRAPRLTGDDHVFLDPTTFAALLRFANTPGRWPLDVLKTILAEIGGHG